MNEDNESEEEVRKGDRPREGRGTEKEMKESINTTTVGGQFKANGRAGGRKTNKRTVG